MTNTPTKLSAEEARRFAHFSLHNAVEAELACPTGECRAYQDCFTFRRWLAQGYVVKKGEKATRITTWIPIRKRDAEGQTLLASKRRKVAAVFCRHQVEEKKR